jgi:DNA-binding transcriptional ArsR family regulator
LPPPSAQPITSADFQLINAHHLQNTMIALNSLLTAVSDKTRWRVLDELQKHGPLPTSILAKNLNVDRPNLTHHLTFMKKAGMLEQVMGRIYRIPERFLVQGQRVVDFGAVVLRFDKAQHK